MKLTLMRAATTIAIVLFSATASRGDIAIVLFSTIASRGDSATKYAISGRLLKLGFANSTYPDCSTGGRPTIRLIRAPEHGRVTISQTRDFPSFPVSSIRSECNRRRVAGAAVYYVSQRGFLGTDYVDVEVIFANGELRQRSFTINVR
jgi:hypothetical protein